MIVADLQKELTQHNPNVAIFVNDKGRSKPVEIEAVENVGDGIGLTIKAAPKASKSGSKK